MMLAIACSGILGTGAAGIGYRESLALQAQILTEQLEQNAASRLRFQIGEAQNAIRAYLLFQRLDDLERFHQAAALIEGPEGRRVARLIDADPITIGAPSVEGVVNRALEQRRNAVQQIAEGQLQAVIAGASIPSARQTIDEAQAGIGRFIEHRRQGITQATVRMDRIQQLVLLLVGGSAVLSGLGLWIAWMMIRRRSAEAEAARGALSARSDEVGALLRMNEMLQACQTRDDIEHVVSHTALKVLPEAPGSLYVFANSRDRLDRAAAWPEGAHGDEADHFSPTHCWALKRGRPHSCGGEGLRCEHSGRGDKALCLPMAARGEVYGVLRFGEAAMQGDDSVHQRQLADALADGVSMALANLSLREKLRGEALRDAMTGLYNRRFLEEVAPAFIQQAARRSSPVCVAMVDVDHFKRVNDTHGHAVGDALLRALAATLTGALRSSDIVCRYGGEEFLMLLPDCDLGAAFERVDDVRRRVQAMHEGADTALPNVTASFGIAVVPPGAATLDDAIRQADEALYAAKQAGRNRVLTAPMIGRGGLEAITAAPDHPDG